MLIDREKMLVLPFRKTRFEAGSKTSRIRLCATSVSSVSLWLQYTDTVTTEDKEVAQRVFRSRN
jgi:hypothetical protein